MTGGTHCGEERERRRTGLEIRRRPSVAGGIPRLGSSECT